MPYNLTNSSTIRFFKTPLLLVFFWGVFGVSTSFSQDYRAEFDSIKKRGVKAFRARNLFELRKSVKQIEKLHEKYQDSLLLAKQFHFRALESKLSFQLDSAYYYYLKSKEVYRLLKDSLETGKRLLGIAVLKREANDFIGSEQVSIESIEYLEAAGSKRFLRTIYNNLGLVNVSLNDFETAEKYLIKALSIQLSYYDLSEKLFIINNLGWLFQQRNELKEALVYFRKGLSLSGVKESFPMQYVLLLENKIYTEYKLGLINSPLEGYKEVLALREKLNDRFGLSGSHFNYADFFKEKRDTVKALWHLKKALYYSKTSNNNRRQLNSLQELSALTSGETSKAYMRQYIHLNDSLIKKERTVKNQFARIRYETQKKEEENQQLLATNKANKEEIRFQKQQKLFGWLFAALSLLGLIIGGLLVVLRRKELLHKAQLQKERARFEERDRIAKELHDGIVGRLFGARFGLGMVQLQEAPEGVSEVYQQYLNELQQIEKDIRDVSHRLQQELPKDEDFITGLKRSMELQCEAVSLEYQITTDPQIRWELIETTVLWHVLRVVQEAVQNVIKHANATEVRIEFQQQKEMLTLKISDNGRGFDPVTASEGIGLRNIKSRLTEIGGELTITSKSGEGTSLLIFLAT